MSSSMRPCSLVEEPGFKYLLHVLEPCYNTSTYEPNYSLFHIQQNTDVDRARVVCCTLRFTNDRWVDLSCHGTLSNGAHFIDSDWEMKTSVLQTQPLYELHTSAPLAVKLQEVVAECKLERPGTTISVTTDNAKNIVNAVREAGLVPHVACFAHTLNLASQKALAVNQFFFFFPRFFSFPSIAPNCDVGTEP